MTAELQRLARDTFNLDAAMAALPAYRPLAPPSATERGQAGYRLQAHIVAAISDDLLREFAKDRLGAARCSEQYLDALRVVLGNQAKAEKYGYVLEINLRVRFATQRVMRTIIDQMRARRISFGVVIGCGKGRSQVVQCFAQKQSRGGRTAAEELEQRDRRLEAVGDVQRNDAIVHSRYVPVSYPFLVEEDIPY